MSERFAVDDPNLSWKQREFCQHKFCTLRRCLEAGKLEISNMACGEFFIKLLLVLGALFYISLFYMFFYLNGRKDAFCGSQAHA